MNSKLKLLCDFLPLIAFFLGYKLGDLTLATALIMAATLVSLAITYAFEKRIAINPLLTGGVVMVFGGLTLWLNDERFIKLKPTIINLLFAAVLLGGAFVLKKGLLRYVFEMAFTLPDSAWRTLSVRWGVFFVFLAILNECIWRNFSTDFWVSFKVFGMFSCTLLFTLFQVPFVKRHMQETQN